MLAHILISILVSILTISVVKLDSYLFDKPHKKRDYVKMVIFSNFVVFFLLFILHMFNYNIKDLFKLSKKIGMGDKSGMTYVPELGEPMLSSDI